MKILIFGASGFMGLPTAQALVRAGHHVIGQSRDINNKAMFEKEESKLLCCLGTNSNYSSKLTH